MNPNQLKALEITINIKVAQADGHDLTTYVEFLEENTTFSDYQIEVLLERINGIMNYRDLQIAAEYVEDHLDW